MKPLVTLSLVTAVTAQQSIYGQCGGSGWTGATTCVANTYCAFQNQYYSQCLPGTSSVATTLITSTTTATSAASTIKTTSTISPVPSPVPSSCISSVNGLLFDIDGKTSYFAGTNSYWIGFLTNNADVDLVMSHLQYSGLKVLRVWGFNDVTTTPGTGTVWFQSFISGQNPVINTGPNGLQRLDYVVKSAAAHGVKLIINFVNNWSAYGGMAAYLDYYGGSTTDWYTSPTIQTQYKTYIKAVVSRYLHSPTIFAWELANEVRCTGCDTSVIYNWASSTSAYIKSIDPKHMVTLGDEGFGNIPGGDGSYPYTTSDGVDFVKNLGISTLDFGTFHMYPDEGWGETDAWGNGWITTHAAACKAANKPCILEEYGTTGDHVTVESQWQATALSVKGQGLAGDMFWDEGDTISTGQTPDDGNTIYYETSEWTALVTEHVAAIG